MSGGSCQIRLQEKVTSDLGLEGWVRFVPKGVEDRKSRPGRGNRKNTRRKPWRWARCMLLGAWKATLTGAGIAEGWQGRHGPAQGEP